MTMGVKSVEKDNKEEDEEFKSEGIRRKNQSHEDVMKDHKEKPREDQYAEQLKNNELISFQSPYESIRIDFRNERLIPTLSPRLWKLHGELTYHKHMFNVDSNYCIEPQKQVALYNDIIHQFSFKDKSILRNFPQEERKLQKFNDIKSSSQSIKNYQEPRKSKNFNQLLINYMLEVVTLKIQNAIWSKELTNKLDYNNNHIIPNATVHASEFLLKREDKKSKSIRLDDKKMPENINQIEGEEQEKRIEVFRQPPEGAIREYFAERENISYEYKEEQSAKDKKVVPYREPMPKKPVSKCKNEPKTTGQNSENQTDIVEEELEKQSKPKRHSNKYSEDAQVELCGENPEKETCSMSADSERNPDFMKDLSFEDAVRDSGDGQEDMQAEPGRENTGNVPVESGGRPDVVDGYMEETWPGEESKIAMHEESGVKQTLSQSKPQSSQDVHKTKNDENMTELSPDFGFFEDEGCLKHEEFVSADKIIEDLKNGRERETSSHSMDSGIYAEEDSKKTMTSNDAGAGIPPENGTSSVNEAISNGEADLSVQKFPDPKQKTELQTQNGKDIDFLTADLYQNTISDKKVLNKNYNVHLTENNQKMDMIYNENKTQNQKEPRNFDISDQRMSENFIKKLAERINSGDENYELKFKYCDLTKELLCLLMKKISGGKSKMLNLTVGYTDNVTALFPEICEILFSCKTEKLSLEYDDLKHSDMKIFYDCLQSRSQSPITELKEIDVSYNTHLGPDGFSKIGEIMHEQNINSLKAANCNFTDDVIEKLREGLHGTKVVGLDISGSKDMSSDGYANLARFITDSDVKCLNLCDCQLTTKKVGAFCEALLKANEEADTKVMLEDLDISYNPLMEPDAYKNIGRLVWKCGVKKLSLAGCGLDRDNLVRLTEVKERKKMMSVDAADNVGIGRGIIEIAKIVKDCELEELNLSDCMFSAGDLEEFKKALEGAKLKVLDLSDYDRSPNEEYISEICKLFSNVTHELRLQFRCLSKSCRRLLQEELNKLPKTDLKIIVDDDNGYISWQEKNEETGE